MDRRIVIVLNEPLRNEDRVFKVVTTPRHERDKHVAAKCEFTAVRTRAVGDDHSLFDTLTDLDDRTLVDTGVLVRTLEFDQRVNVGGHLA